MAFRPPVHLSAEDHLRVSNAVALAEKDCDGEIVTIVTDISDAYADTPYRWAAIMTFFVMAVMLLFPAAYQRLIDTLTGGWSQHIAVQDTLFITLSAALLIYLIVWALLQWRPLRLAFTNKSIKARRVHDRAVTAFRIGAESRTRGATAVLIYLSLAEHRAEIVADAAIAQKVAPEAWGDAMAVLIEEVKAGRAGEGMAAAVAAVGALLATHFPLGESNPNELPDRLIEL